MGGMIADQISDLVQFAIIIVGLAIATPIVMSKAGGWSAISAMLPGEKLNFTQIGWASIIGYILNYFCTFLAGPEMVSRFETAKDEKTARKLFAQAKKMGIGTVVVVPFERGKAEEGKKPQNVESEKALDILEKLVKEFDIRAAIHNHGPDMPKLYPTAEAVMARVANRDRRIGCCLDIGHEQRAGFDPVAAIRKYGDRIYDVHLKNIHKADKSGHAVPGPRGALDIRGVFKALADVNYTGVCHIEYERDFENNAMGLAESFGYYRGVLDGLGL